MRQPDVCNAKLEIGALTFDEVESLSGHEAIGEPFRYDVRVSMALPLPRPSALLGTPATLTLEDAFGQRTLHGIASEVETSTTDMGRGEVRVAIEPRTHTLTLGRASRSFQDRSAIEAVEALVAPASPVVRALSRAYPKAPYRAQRGEDDWSFVTRTLEAEGVTFYYDHDDESALVLTDNTRAAPPVAGSSVFPYHPDGLEVASEAIVSLARRAAVTTTTVTRRSFAWKNPTLALAVTSGKGRYESYDAPGGGPTTPSALERAAQDAKDAALARASGVAGEAATLRLYPGRTFSIAAIEADEPWFAEEWLVTSIDIQLAGRKRTFVTHFNAIAKSIPFRPSPRVASAGRKGAVEAWGGAEPGLSWGVVVASRGDEVYPDESGRVRVQMHWDRSGARDASAGTWMRVAQRCNPGSMMFPRTGWHVATVNEEGSVDAPSVLSRIHDGERPPEYPLPANKTRVVWKTATSPGGGSYNEVHFEDAKGREDVFWNASRDMNILTKNDAGERVDNDAWHKVGANQTVQSGQSYAEQVNHHQTVRIAASQTTSVGGDRAKTVGASDTVTVGGSRTLKVGESHALGVTGDRTLSVGAALMDISLGQIATTARTTRTLVGGAVVRLSAKNYTEDASVASAELVGAAKVETAGENRVIGVEKRFIEAVGGGARVDAGKRYIDSATRRSSWVVGGAITGRTKEITLEGYTSIELRCGDSAVVVEPEQIRIEAKTLKLNGAELEALTSIIVHNG